MGLIHSVVNQKGGVGKTTLSFNLAWALGAQGKKVLLVDNDPQGNLTSYTGVEAKSTIDEIYVSRRVDNALVKESLTPMTDQISILAADNMLSGVEYYLASRADKEFVLRNALNGLRDQFDVILIDNPPSLNLITVNGLMASDSIFVPVQLEFFSLEGLVALEKTVGELRAKNPVLNIAAIIPNMFDDRRKLNWEVLEALKKEYGSKVLNVKIHDCVKIAESSGHGLSVMSYSPKSRSATEYKNLAEELFQNVTGYE
jgi:chromosome partitioning protein